MPAIINEDSAPREIWVTFVHPDTGKRTTHQGEPVNGAIDSALFGAAHAMGFGKPKVSILHYGVALWGFERSDSRTVIPFHDVIKIEEVF